jgi:hypothetical protein
MTIHLPRTDYDFGEVVSGELSLELIDPIKGKQLWLKLVCIQDVDRPTWRIQAELEIPWAINVRARRSIKVKKGRRGQAIHQATPVPEGRVTKLASQSRYCGSCGGSLDAGARFCGECGVKLRP